MMLFFFKIYFILCVGILPAGMQVIGVYKRLRSDECIRASWSGCYGTKLNEIQIPLADITTRNQHLVSHLNKKSIILLFHFYRIIQPHHRTPLGILNTFLKSVSLKAGFLVDSFDQGTCTVSIQKDTLESEKYSFNER